MQHRDTLTPKDLQAFESDTKVGLLATKDASGRPDITLITTLQGKDPDQLTWGQFCEGRSKANVRVHPELAWLVMTPAREVWRGRARWTHAVTEGPDYERYNQKPLFRYNTYFGIHTVHFMDLVSTTPKGALPLPGLILGSLGAALARLPARSWAPEPILKPWSVRHFNGLDTIKFVAWIGADGWPRLVPAVPAAAAGSRRLVLVGSVYSRELAEIPAGAELAVFALNMKTENVMVRGVFSGWRGLGPACVGALDLTYVYNSMPPQNGQIYPPVSLEAVAGF